jgi:hypothetical protein
MAPYELRTPRAGVLGLVFVAEGARIPAIELAATKTIPAGPSRARQNRRAPPVAASPGPPARSMSGGSVAAPCG